MAECLRLFPPAAILTRVSIADDTFEGVRIAGGTLIVISPYLLHRDPRFHDRAIAFEPARWLPSTLGRAATHSAYLPFGAGPRGCVGETFAWTEGVLVLAALASRWRVRPIDPQAIEAEVRSTLRPKGPVRARLESRVST